DRLSRPHGCEESRGVGHSGIRGCRDACLTGITRDIAAAFLATSRCLTPSRIACTDIDQIVSQIHDERTEWCANAIDPRFARRFDVAAFGIKERRPALLTRPNCNASA